jgi:hypothetical protein
MLSGKMIKRGLAGALAFAAVASPVAAQAAFVPDGGGGGVPAPVSTQRDTQPAGSGFQWGDAGIGALAAVTVMGAGAASSGAARRRRTHRTVLG